MLYQSGERGYAAYDFYGAGEITKDQFLNGLAAQKSGLTKDELV